MVKSTTAAKAVETPAEVTAEPSATGRIEVSTQIEVEDFTDAEEPAAAPDVRVEETKLDGGTVLTTYF